jgi:hypothetical protein
MKETLEEFVGFVKEYIGPHFKGRIVWVFFFGMYSKLAVYFLSYVLAYSVIGRLFTDLEKDYLLIIVCLYFLNSWANVEWKVWLKKVKDSSLG